MRKWIKLDQTELYDIYIVLISSIRYLPVHTVSQFVLFINNPQLSGWPHHTQYEQSMQNARSEINAKKKKI